MSFLVDPPLLYSAGHRIGRRAPANAQLPLAGAALGAFYAVSVPLYLDRRWTRPLWRLMGARSGRDFMLNSRVLCCNADAAGPRIHVVAALLFAIAYPLALLSGFRAGRRSRDRKLGT